MRDFLRFSSPGALQRRLAASEGKRLEAVTFYESKLARLREEIHTARAASGASRRAIERLEAVVADRNRALAQAEAALESVQRYERGSLSEGNADWSARWDSGRPRVALLAARDYAGSMYGWASALNRYTDWAARLVTMYGHRFQYPQDLVYGAPTLVPDEFYELMRAADVIHIKDEAGLLQGRDSISHNLLHDLGSPRVFTQYGGIARSREHEQDYRAFVMAHDAVVSITPDLCFPWLSEVRFVPHAVDVSTVSRRWSDGWLVSHSPSDRARKGTSDFLTAVERLQRRFPLNIDIIEDVPNAICVERKAQSNLFFDQAGTQPSSDTGSVHVIGWYGNSALEASVRGIPTVAHLSDAALEGSRHGGSPDFADSCAIINTPLGVDGIEATIGAFFDAPASHRASLSEATRTWVEEYHSEPVVAAQLADVYESLPALR